MTRWVRSRRDDEGVFFLWEVADDGWITRAVELVGAERRVKAAAALHEVIRARDTGGLLAVRAYEARFGIAPESPILDWNFPHEEIDQLDFESEWAAARRGLGP